MELSAAHFVASALRNFDGHRPSNATTEGKDVIFVDSFMLENEIQGRFCVQVNAFLCRRTLAVAVPVNRSSQRHTK